MGRKHFTEEQIASGFVVRGCSLVCGSSYKHFRFLKQHLKLEDDVC